MTLSAGEVSGDTTFWNSTYHKRVDHLFLPLSVRQNRIEDVFADFLAELVKQAGRERQVERTRDRFGALRLAMESGTPGLELPSDESKRDLVFRWLREELVREERTSNRRQSGDAAYSLTPLHLAVAERFGRPVGNIPAYGALLYEMLSICRETGQEGQLVGRVWAFFNQSEGDPLAAVLELALRAPAVGMRPSIRWPRSNAKLVRCPSHAEQFQRDVQTVLRFKVSRRTMLVWLYSLFTFYLATYFLRMAIASERCSRALEASLKGRSESYRPCDRCQLDPSASLTSNGCSNPFSIILGERNHDHARLLKRYPFHTSEWQVARSFAPDKSLDGMDEAEALRALMAFLYDASKNDSEGLEGWFELLSESYPVDTDNVGRRNVEGDSTKWALSQEDKDQALRLLHEGQATAFETVALYLNFEDMDRSSNNMKEWQLYRALARHPIYGFARGRGEGLDYALGEGLLTAFVHCHVGELGEEATVRSLEEALEQRGLSVVDAYRSELLKTLVNLGLVQDVADSGDAKRLTVLYEADVPR